MYNNNICTRYRVRRRGICLRDKVDQFTSSEFFTAENGLELSDVMVFAKSQADPELRKRLETYLVEQDVAGFDDSVSDDDVFNAVENKYFSARDVLDKIKGRISELRAKERAEKEYNDYLDNLRKETSKVKETE